MGKKKRYMLNPKFSWHPLSKHKNTEQQIKTEEIKILKTPPVQNEVVETKIETPPVVEVVAPKPVARQEAKIVKPVQTTTPVAPKKTTKFVKKAETSKTTTAKKTSTKRSTKRTSRTKKSKI
tara:strand:- start:433 stop:798 length:366 start_codon:yes stop_codon:yes gene_type:complete